MRRRLTRRMILAVVLPGLVVAVATAWPGQAATPRQEQVGQVVVQDIRVPVAGQPAIQAYLVRGEGVRPGSQAGVLWLHWLGQIHSDRTEFLAEAIQMASRGVVSVLPQGTFPWLVNPIGTPQDVTLIRQQLEAFRATLDALIASRYVDPSRVAVVGHDYGAMYGALLAGVDTRVSAAVLATPDATWGHWFVKYWLGYKGERETKYKALFSELEPGHHVSRLGGRELFQWAGQDIYVSEGVRRQFAQAAPHAKVELYANSDHQLITQAQLDRDRFLEQVLGLPK
jgi:dienelactone hydrolase